MSVPEFLSTDQLNDVSGGDVTVTIANPLTADYVGLPPKGTTLGGGVTGPDCVLSISPDGTPEVRPTGTDGPWERARIQGMFLVYSPDNGRVFPLPVAKAHS